MHAFGMDGAAVVQVTVLVPILVAGVPAEEGAVISLQSAKAAELISLGRVALLCPQPEVADEPAPESIETE
jgi:hypothetical protein